MKKLLLLPLIMGMMGCKEPKEKLNVIGSIRIDTVERGIVLYDEEIKGSSYAIINGRFCKKENGGPIDTLLMESETDAFSNLVSQSSLILLERDIHYWIGAIGDSSCFAIINDKLCRRTGQKIDTICPVRIGEMYPYSLRWE